MPERSETNRSPENEVEVEAVEAKLGPREVYEVVGSVNPLFEAVPYGGVSTAVMDPRMDPVAPGR